MPFTGCCYFVWFFFLFIIIPITLNIVIHKNVERPFELSFSFQPSWHRGAAISSLPGCSWRHDHVLFFSSSELIRFSSFIHHWETKDGEPPASLFYPFLSPTQSSSLIELSLLTFPEWCCLWVTFSAEEVASPFLQWFGIQVVICLEDKVLFLHRYLSIHGEGGMKGDLHVPQDFWGRQSPLWGRTYFPGD